LPDFPTVLVTFARPEESRAFRRRFEKRNSTVQTQPELHCGMIGQVEVAVAHTGIGPEAAAVAIHRLFPLAPWTCVLAAGFAGGLDPQLSLGDVVIETRPSSEPCRLISRPLPVESVEEKARVFRETGAAAVDMETDTLAAACAVADIPFTAVRVISDPANTALPVPFAAWFDLKNQRPKPLGLLAYLVRHPRGVPPFVRFLRGLSFVAENLAAAVENRLSQATPRNGP
jgi:adenosylhomocysteine nucleosidase